MKLKFLMLMLVLMAMTSSQLSLAAPMMLMSDQKRNLEVGVTMEEGDASMMTKALEAVPVNSQAQIIVTTDSEEVVAETIAWANRTRPKKAPQFLFAGQILKQDPLNKFLGATKRYKEWAHHKIQRDPINFYFSVITFGMETIYWITADSGSIGQKGASILFGGFILGTLGLDKDLWTNSLSRPIEGRIMKGLEKFKLVTGKEGINSPTRIATRFFSNLSVSLALQTIRMGVFSFDNLLTTVTTGHFWLNSILLGTTMTFSTMGWSEMLAGIDQDKYPMTKNTLRRFAEIRGLLLNALAPSAHVLQPGTYGYQPLFFLLVNGTVGLAAMLGADKIKNWYENLEWVELLEEKIEKFNRKMEPHMQKLNRVLGIGVPRCQLIYF